MRTTTLKEQERKIEKRKSLLGLPSAEPALANSGARRTPEKRALLKALEEEAVRQGRQIVFPSNF